MILLKQKCCLWSTGVSTESQNLLLYFTQGRIFLATTNMTRIDVWSCAELCEDFTFFMENIYVQFDGMVYKQIVGIPMGANSAPLIAD